MLGAPPAVLGAPIEAGGITIFSHHVHGLHATFTVPLPENLALQLPLPPPGLNVPLDIRVVPLEQAPGAAPTTRFARWRCRPRSPKSL